MVPKLAVSSAGALSLDIFSVDGGVGVGQLLFWQLVGQKRQPQPQPQPQPCPQGQPQPGAQGQPQPGAQAQSQPSP